MRTHEEIKEWIDEKKVLSKTDLVRFMYKYISGGRYKNESRVTRYWDYVLKTKNMKDLREYRDYKIKNGNRRGDAQKIRTIIKKDKRFDCGSRRGKRLMLDLYGIKVGRGAISNYIKECYAPKKID